MAGGGPAGATAALLLARAGRAVTLIEREAAPAHKVCGEFIAGDALAHLGALGIDLAARGAQPITRLRLVRGSGSVEAALPFAAMGFSRRALDAALLDAAAAAGATVLRGHTIRQCSNDRLLVDGVGEMRAKKLFLATGKHELRGAARRLRRRAAETVGFKLHLTLSPAQSAALGEAIELMLFRDSYAGLQRIEGGLANLCLVTPRSRLLACGDWPGLLAGLAAESPHLHGRLAGATGWPKPLAIARVPYGHLHRHDPAEPGTYRLGDQMGVIHSFTGDGIAIALHSARLAVGCFLDGQPPETYHAKARADIRGPIRLASSLYQAGHARAVQAAIMGVARWWPGLLQTLAGSTRAGW